MRVTPSCRRKAKSPDAELELPSLTYAIFMGTSLPGVGCGWRRLREQSRLRAGDASGEGVRSPKYAREEQVSQAQAPVLKFGAAETQRGVPLCGKVSFAVPCGR
jgi:hypothetical protein